MGRRVYGRKNFDKPEKSSSTDGRFAILSALMIIAAGVIILRLFFLMIMQHGFYVALAQGTQEIYAKLVPERGDIFVQDSRTGEEYKLAINADYFVVFADTRLIETDKVADQVTLKLAEVFEYDDEKKLKLFVKLNKRDDPYEPIEQKVPQATVDLLREADLPGIGFIRRSYRYYPEANLASHVVGFLGKDDDGRREKGRYGVEGYWDKELAGSGGFLEGSRTASGRWISLAAKSFEPAENGADFLLTIDRTLQFKACERLREGMEEFKASSAALVMMDPNTGAIVAMCSFPDFDPNVYNEVESIQTYNNTAIFTPYEPGSIFKPIAMAAALNEEKLQPDSPFYDSGSKSGVCDRTIRNADSKIYEDTDMSGVLENSINTGMVYVVEQVGKKLFKEYIENFGFGVREGLELDSERSGTLNSLSINKADKVDCYTATASFGQGITATPLQMVASFAAIANGGSLLKPYIVDEIRFSDGRTEKTKKTVIREVITSRASQLLSGMLVNVVDSGHAGRAKVDGYYVAGKTGTAQIAGRGGYTDETNHSFVGFAPVDDPKFVMIVKYEKPQRRFSASTAANIFGDIARFALQYYQVAPTR
jgi:stage V sporulation protein D (sporulation-specific penicillin-binding protein)